MPDWNALSTAVTLAKTDLTTELVKEFTELQGVIGGLYARAQGLGETVAQAIYDQYRPASTDDAIPRTVEGQLLGLADRIQTITAMFGIGNAPTGSKDPFALRRAANAIVSILAESGLPLNLGDVIGACSVEQADRLVSHPSGKNKDATRVGHPDGETTKEQVKAFLRERLHFYLKDVRGFAYDVVNAVLAAGADDVRDAIARAEALTAARGVGGFCGDFGGVQADQEHSAAGRGEGICDRVGERCEAGGGGAAAGGCGGQSWRRKWHCCAMSGTTARRWGRLRRCDRRWMRSSTR